MIRFGAHFESKPHRASLRFPRAMGLVVAQEVKDLLGDPYTPHAFPPALQAADQGVTLENASLRTLGELCLRLTTAKDVIWHLGDARVVFEHELAKALEKIPWQAILPEDSSLELRISTAESRVYHSGLIAQCAAKSLVAAGIAVAERGKGITTLELTLRANKLSLGLSLAGASLNRRGLRHGLSHRAPLNECLAAAVLRFAESAALHTAPELKDLTPQIHVPFAGSGTFGFEALLRFGRISPCVFRQSYAVEQLRCMPHMSLVHTRDRARKSIVCRHLQIHFSEIDPALCDALRIHSEDLSTRLKQFGLGEPLIQVAEGDFFSLPSIPDSDSPGCLLLNPPYGQRLDVERNFFSALGEKVAELYSKRSLPVWGLALLPPGRPSASFTAALGRRSCKKIAVRNGGIPVEAVAFLIR